MNEKTIEAKAQKLRNEAIKYASARLSRGSLRIQDGAFATESEWRERRTTQARRIARINEGLSAG